MSNGDVVYLNEVRPQKQWKARKAPAHCLNLRELRSVCESIRETWTRPADVESRVAEALRRRVEEVTSVTVVSFAGQWRVTFSAREDDVEYHYAFEMPA